MAQVGRNIIINGLRGKLGNLIIFRSRGNKTFAYLAPEKRKTQWSAAQKENRSHFQEAVLYAKGANADMETKKAYNAVAKPGQHAYNVAIADFMNAPHIDQVDVSEYTGKPGSFIKIMAVDDFRVTEVSVTILNEDGSLVEKGKGVKEQESNWWRYTATAQNSQLTGDKIIIRASDMPGHLHNNEMTLN